MRRLIPVLCAALIAPGPLAADDEPCPWNDRLACPDIVVEPIVIEPTPPAQGGAPVPDGPTVLTENMQIKPVHLGIGAVVGVMAFVRSAGSSF